MNAASSCTGAVGGTCPDYTIGVPEQNCNNVAAGPYLSIDGSATYQAAIFAAGYGISQTRPCGAIADCFETVGASSENIDAELKLNNLTNHDYQEAQVADNSCALRSTSASRRNGRNAARSTAGTTTRPRLEQTMMSKTIPATCVKNLGE